MKIPTALSLFALMLLWPSRMPAQPRARNLSGIVTDRRHEPLKAAVVQVENAVTLGVVSYITQADGTYSFKRLQGNTDYRIWVTFRGHRSKVRKLGAFDSDQPKTLNFVLAPR